MENKQMKCIKVKSCLHCGSNYCRFVDELDQLKAENEHLSEKEEEAKHYLEEAEKFKNCLTEIKEICNSVENIENINSLYDAKLSGMYLQAHKILQKISECEVNNGFWN